MTGKISAPSLKIRTEIMGKNGAVRTADSAVFSSQLYMGVL